MDLSLFAVPETQAATLPVALEPSGVEVPVVPNGGETPPPPPR